jgi:hypothetical protein
MKGRRSSAARTAAAVRNRMAAGTSAAERNRMAARTGTPSASAAAAGCNGGVRPRTAAAVDAAAGGDGRPCRPARSSPSGSLQARRQATRNGNHFNAANILQSAKCLRGRQWMNQRTQKLKTTWMRLTLRRGHADMGVRVVVAHRSSVCSEANTKLGTNWNRSGCVACVLWLAQKKRGKGCCV